MKNLRSAPHLADSDAFETQVVRVLIADSGPIQSQLLARALRAKREFEVTR